MGNCLRWLVWIGWCQRSLWVPWAWCCNRCFPVCFLWSRHRNHRFGWRLLLRWRNEYLWLWECGSWNQQLWSFRRCRCTMWKRRYGHGRVQDFAMCVCCGGGGWNIRFLFQEGQNPSNFGGSTSNGLSTVLLKLQNVATLTTCLYPKSQI